LLAILAGLVIAVGGGTAIALAAAGSGPVPPRTSLARAIHTALGAHQVMGITARVRFTNHLIDSSDIQGSDPILTGATGRLWLSGDHQLRLELQSDNGDAQLVVNKRAFWVYDPSSHTVYKGTLPAEKAHSAKSDKAAKNDKIPSVARIQRGLNRLARHINLSTAIPGDVAGHGAYTVRVSPQHDGGLLGAAEVAWDSVRGVPLRFAIYARGDTAPVLELKATDISYGAVPASDFAAAPPSNAKVVKVATPQHSVATSKKHAKVRVSHGVAAVAHKVPFKLGAPASLVGLKRRSATLLDWSGHPAAVVTYGQNLGGIAVIEQTAQPPVKTPSGDHEHGVSLPTVSINGVTGQELDTALGTMVRFTRSGVTYTVIGSVPPVAADQAARAL
jgi:outer membrane lipoprotein-sorting protein